MFFVFLGIEVTPLLILCIGGTIELVFEYIALKYKYKKCKYTERKESIQKELNSFWKLPSYYIVFFLILHIFIVILL